MKTCCLLPLVIALIPGAALSQEGSAPASEMSAQDRRRWGPCGTTAVRLADISPGLPGSEPGELVHGDGVLFFTADDGSRGRELWRSSGTGGDGTFLVKDIRLGSAGSDPRELTMVGGRLFFTADDGMHGRELWVSDGTAAGTSMVKDILPGPEGAIPISFPFPSEDAPGRLLLEFKGLLYFSADDGVRGRELWVSDGTAAGTALLEELNPGSENASPRRFIRAGDSAFYFVANEGFNVHLWRSTGAPGATSVLERVEDNVIFRLTLVQSRLFFLVDNDEGEASLWKTDGTAASTRHLRFFHGEYPHDLVAAGRRLVFSAGGPDSGGPEEPEGEELWVSDGTVAGTKLLKDIRPGAEGSAPGALAVLSQRIFFAADDGAGLGRELWVSDGTTAGTVLFRDVEPGAGSSSPEALTAIQGTLFFSAFTSGQGRELWASDGTAAGTRRLGELAPGVASSSPRGMIRSGWDVFFTADDGVTGRELWALPFRPEGSCGPSRRVRAPSAPDPR